jgi:hypothetical protein
MSLSKAPTPALPTGSCQSAGNIAERGVRAGLGVGCGGRMADRVPVLPNLTIKSLIPYSYTAGKAVNQTSF